ncbi:hypothetical protein HOP62_15320 [Halomonas sp. MCCC 1A17488]|uniref:Uncharacterized protein n=1 Tax=Billgrantia sulfidoxydans TaxID=2733484 RepID=A0ABX7WCD0_9GAMM|nr:MULTISPECIES: hypothetical protein [Halomonas]MCE8017447.1 hypothetical protein [Halomonas sp. MCCC 1A17488]MCG3240780.1 hypothetical protein [Halomonas sp. MCCC 1A17488]QPP49384.1 hypothetical protein I4484_19820 [Halomonas sp. SS10-MC5]QTP56743.1 hypothetical protein HNO51_19905 [Halomonas sulfidoxydans]
MTSKARGTAYGAWLLLAISAISLILAAVATFNEGNGIAHTPGTYLVLTSTALLLVGSLLLALWHGLPRWLGGLLTFLLLLDLLGTGLAAYLLQTEWLLGAVGVGLVAWLIHVIADPATGTRNQHKTQRQGAAS